MGPEWGRPNRVDQSTCPVDGTLTVPLLAPLGHGFPLGSRTDGVLDELTVTRSRSSRAGCRAAALLSRVATS